MASGATIGAGFLADFSRLVDELGGDAAALLESVGMEPARLENPDSRLDYVLYADLLDHGNTRTGPRALPQDRPRPPCDHPRCLDDAVRRRMLRDNPSGTDSRQQNPQALPGDSCS